MSQLVIMYFIEGIPFTFDDVPDAFYYDKEITELADCMGCYELDDIYKSSNYLISEECHPMLFEMNLKINWKMIFIKYFRGITID